VWYYLDLSRLCCILELFWQCGIIWNCPDCRILELFRQCGIFSFWCYYLTLAIIYLCSLVI
jgi:hypothetical protein